MGNCVKLLDGINDEDKRKTSPQRRKGWYYLTSLAVIGVLLVVLFPCVLGHEWSEASCEQPQMCMVCEKTVGEAIGHRWSEATCTRLSTCSVCSKTRGELLPHQWKAADCKNPKTCTVCGKTEGSTKDHTWVSATDVTPQRCIKCGTMLPLSRPKTGEIFEGKNKTRSSTLLLENTTDLDCYGVLKNIDLETEYSFYVRANESKHISVPSGEFYLYISQGTDWYGPEYFFGEGTEPKIDSELMDFNKYWWTFTLTR